MMAKTLYICYFGVREPLVQTQVVPYLRELRNGGFDGGGNEEIRVSLLTFEPAESIEKGGFDEIRTKLAAEGISWHWLKYHKRPSVPATALDIIAGARCVRNLLRRERFDVLHARVHIPMLMAALARKYSAHKPKLLFDIRGFFPEEYTDAGIWPEDGWLYRSAKRVESWLMREADGFVVLTEKAREILFPESKETGFVSDGRPVEVIPCCVDISRFAGGISKEASREKLGSWKRFVIAYVGSFGGWYMTDEMMELFEAAREFHRDAFVLVLTQRDKEKIADELKKRGFGPGDMLVESVSPSEIPAYLGAADAAVSLIKACYSKLSSSPTKIAEYLACGVPIIANRGVGDVDRLIESNRVGSILEDLSRESYLKALQVIKDLGDVSSRCRETARREFDLEKVGGERYRRLYTKLLDQDRNTLQDTPL